jgi:hypothetical protein
MQVYLPAAIIPGNNKLWLKGSKACFIIAGKVDSTGLSVYCRPYRATRQTLKEKELIMIEKFLVRKYGQKVTVRLYSTFIVVILLANAVVPVLVSRDGLLVFLVIEAVIFAYVMVGVVKKRIASRRNHKEWLATQRTA